MYRMFQSSGVDHRVHNVLVSTSTLTHTHTHIYMHTYTYTHTRVHNKAHTPQYSF